MVNRIILISSLVAIVIILVMLNFTTPASIGPLGVLVFFYNILYIDVWSSGGDDAPLLPHDGEAKKVDAQRLFIRYCDCIWANHDSFNAGIWFDESVDAWSCCFFRFSGMFSNK